MSIKNKVNLIKRVISIFIAIPLAILGAIPLLIIPIMSIVELILLGLLKVFPSQKEFELGNDFLEQRFKELQVKYLEDLDSNNLQNSRDVNIENLLFGYPKLNSDRFGEFLKTTRFTEEGSSFFSIVKRTIVIPKVLSKIFLFVFYKALKTTGLPLSTLMEDEYKQSKEIIIKVFSSLFSSLRLKSLTLFRVISCIRTKNISIMEEEIVDILYQAINDSIPSLSSDKNYKWFYDQFKEVRVLNSHSRNERVIENIINIISLLAGFTSNDIRSETEKIELFFGSLMKDLDLRLESDDDRKRKDYKAYTTLPKLVDKDVADLKEKVSSFVNNFLENNTPILSNQKDKEAYFIMCCKKVLGAFMSKNLYGDIQSPGLYNVVVSDIARMLALDITKNLNLKGLANIHTLVYEAPNPLFCDPIVNPMKTSLSRESIMPGLRVVLQQILGITKKHLEADICNSENVTESILPSSLLQDSSCGIIVFYTSNSVNHLRT